jgi:signal transduction histidine kinase
MSLRPNLCLPDLPRLRDFAIGVRLHAGFACVLLLMLLGGGLALWHLHVIQANVEKVSQVEQRLSAIQRLDNRLLKLVGRLHQVAEIRDGRHFEEEAKRFLNEFRHPANQAAWRLEQLPSDTVRQTVILTNLTGILDTLPDRIQSMIELARAGDWTALHARLLRQEDHTDDVMAALVLEIDRGLCEARRLLRNDVESVQRRAMQTLAAGAVLSLLTVMLLGAVVTRSITQPLAKLNAAAGSEAREELIQIAGKDELGRLAIAFDEQKRLEETLREKSIDLERSNQAKVRFLASMSHELRTPLNAIIGFTGTLLMRLPGPLTAEQERQLTTIQASGRHLLSLINDLLDLARIESGKALIHLEPVDCSALIEEIAATLRPLANNKKLRIDLALPGEKVLASTDRRMLSQILLNLTNNAIKFTREGSVSIRLSQQPHHDAAVICFTVADTGIGIRQQDQDKLFQPFSRLHADAAGIEGTGLGLHVSQRLAALLGARIIFESEYGKGSRFTLALPAHSTLTDVNSRSVCA